MMNRGEAEAPKHASTTELFVTWQEDQAKRTPLISYEL